MVIKGRDWLDGFERRVDPRSFDDKAWDSLEKLTVDEKRTLLIALHQKISLMQNNLNQMHQLGSKGKSLDELKLSQMILMWIYDQIKYGKML